MGNRSFTTCLLDNKRSAYLMRLFSYTEDEIPRPIKVTQTLAPSNKLLTQLVNDAHLTLYILGVTAVRNVFKITTSFMVWTYSDVWRVI
jgi:hypothetical protein